MAHHHHQQVHHSEHRVVAPHHHHHHHHPTRMLPHSTVDANNQYHHTYQGHPPPQYHHHHPYQRHDPPYAANRGDAWHGAYQDHHQHHYHPQRSYQRDFQNYGHHHYPVNNLPKHQETYDYHHHQSHHHHPSHQEYFSPCTPPLSSRSSETSMRSPNSEIGSCRDEFGAKEATFREDFGAKEAPFEEQLHSKDGGFLALPISGTEDCGASLEEATSKEGEVSAEVTAHQPVPKPAARRHQSQRGSKEEEKKKIVGDEVRAGFSAGDQEEVEELAPKKKERKRKHLQSSSTSSTSSTSSWCQSEEEKLVSSDDASLTVCESSRAHNSRVEPIQVAVNSQCSTRNVDSAESGSGFTPSLASSDLPADSTDGILSRREERYDCSELDEEMGRALNEITAALGASDTDSHAKRRRQFGTKGRLIGTKEEGRHMVKIRLQRQGGERCRQLNSLLEAFSQKVADKVRKSLKSLKLEGNVLRADVRLEVDGSGITDFSEELQLKPSCEQVDLPATISEAAAIDGPGVSPTSLSDKADQLATISQIVTPSGPEVSPASVSEKTDQQAVLAKGDHQDTSSYTFKCDQCEFSRELNLANLEAIARHASVSFVPNNSESKVRLLKLYKQRVKLTVNSAKASVSASTVLRCRRCDLFEVSDATEALAHLSDEHGLTGECCLCEYRLFKEEMGAHLQSHKVHHSSRLMTLVSVGCSALVTKSTASAEKCKECQSTFQRAPFVPHWMKVERCSRCRKLEDFEENNKKRTVVLCSCCRQGKFGAKSPSMSCCWECLGILQDWRRMEEGGGGAREDGRRYVREMLQKLISRLPPPLPEDLLPPAPISSVPPPPPPKSTSSELLPKKQVAVVPPEPRLTTTAKRRRESGQEETSEVEKEGNIC